MLLLSCPPEGFYELDWSEMVRTRLGEGKEVGHDGQGEARWLCDPGHVTSWTSLSYKLSSVFFSVQWGSFQIKMGFAHS